MNCKQCDATYLYPRLTKDKEEKYSELKIKSFLFVKIFFKILNFLSLNNLNILRLFIVFLK